MNEIHEMNRRGWDAVSPFWQAGIDADGRWQTAAGHPEQVLRSEELDLFNNVKDQQICVLGSGDNLVVFALAGLGAQVTSVDISQVQLDIAAERAAKLGLDINFVRADVTDLAALPDNHFDWVYTGGHVAVWVSDLRQYYREAVRILKPGQSLVINEYHPFRRIWKFEPGPLEIEFNYFERGPFRFDRSEHIPGAEPLPSYEHNWTVSDYVMAVLETGCQLEALFEVGDQKQNWEPVSLVGLPEDLLLVARKPA